MPNSTFTATSRINSHHLVLEARVIEVLWSKIHVGCDCFGESHHEVYRILRISEIERFDRRMHVSHRNGDETSCNSGSRKLDKVGIGSGRPWNTLDLVVYFFLFCGLDKQVENTGIDIGTAGDDRAAADFNIADLLWLDSGLVGCKGYIGGDSYLRIDPKRKLGETFAYSVAISALESSPDRWESDGRKMLAGLGVRLSGAPDGARPDPGE